MFWYILLLQCICIDVNFYHFRYVSCFWLKIGWVYERRKKLLKMSTTFKLIVLRSIRGKKKE